MHPLPPLTSPYLSLPFYIPLLPPLYSPYLPPSPRPPSASPFSPQFGHQRPAISDRSLEAYDQRSRPYRSRSHDQGLHVLSLDQLSNTSAWWTV